MKMIVDADTRVVLGAHMVGDHAAEIMQVALSDCYGYQSIFPPPCTIIIMANYLHFFPLLAFICLGFH